MHRVILDTNILHQEGLSSRNMQQLGRLASAGELEICVPALVRREFLSKRAIDTLESLHRVQKDLKDVARRLEHDQGARGRVANAEARIAELRREICRDMETSYTNWARQHNVRELVFDPASINLVLDDYFAGTGAFRKPKSREDLIDGMISCAIQAARAERTPLYVIVQDGTFRTHLMSLDGVQVLPSLAAYLELADVRATLDRLGPGPVWHRLMNRHLENPRFQEDLRRYLASGQSDILEFVFLEEDDIDGTEELLIQPQWGAQLNGIRAEQGVVINFTAPATDGERSFSIGMEVTGMGYLNYAADYADYYRVGEDNSTLVLESMSGDGACDIRETRRVAVVGDLRIETSEQLDPVALMDAISRGRAVIDFAVSRGRIVA